MAESDDDIERWCALLGDDANGSSNDADASTLQAREASALRAAILRHMQTLQHANPSLEQEDQAWQGLQLRLRREKLAGHAGLAAWLRGGWLPMASAAVLALALTLHYFPGLIGMPAESESYPMVAGEAPLYRGGLLVIEIAVDDPGARAQSLAARISRQGMKPSVFSEGARAVLDVQLAETDLASARKEFSRAGVPETGLQAGMVRVVFNQGQIQKK